MFYDKITFFSVRCQMCGFTMKLYQKEEKTEAV